jgi:hypothetical protein
MSRLTRLLLHLPPLISCLLRFLLQLESDLNQPVLAGKSCARVLAGKVQVPVLHIASPPPHPPPAPTADTAHAHALRHDAGARQHPCFKVSVERDGDAAGARDEWCSAVFRPQQLDDDAVECARQVVVGEGGTLKHEAWSCALEVVCAASGLQPA